MVKEVDLRIGFTKYFQSISRYQKMEPEELRKRLLLCLYGIGSNMGLKRVSIANAL